MEQHPNGFDTLTLYNLLAPRANLSKLLIIVERAIRLLVTLKVLSAREVNAALTAAETLGMPRPHKRKNGPSENRFSATRANVLDKLCVADKAVILTVVLLAVTPDKLGTTGLAAVMLGMDLLTVQDHVVAEDRLLALGADVVLTLTQADTSGAALDTVGIALILLVLCLEKRGTALGAGKVLGVVETVAKLDALLENGLLAHVADVPKVLIVAVLAINVPFLFHKWFYI